MFRALRRPLTLRAPLSSADDLAAVFAEAGLALAPVERSWRRSLAAGTETRLGWLLDDLLGADCFDVEQGKLQPLGWEQALAAWEERLRRLAPA